MFNKSIDDRLSSWAIHRNELDTAADPIAAVWEFWKHAPFIPYNKKVDPHYRQSWPSPWEIIVDNHYDDFTKALMIAWTFALSNKFKNSKIEVKTLLDKQKNIAYNIVCIDDKWVVNYDDSGPTSIDDLPSTLYLENIIGVSKTS